MDQDFYISFHRDVEKVYGKNAIEHYKKHGKNEKRIISLQDLYSRHPLLKYFNIEYYKNQVKNKDLNDINLLSHFLNSNENFNFKIEKYGFNLEKSNIITLLNPKKISVLLAVYNSEKTIESSINSILNQSYKNIELIIINDCSTDYTGEIIEKYKKHPNVFIVNNSENYGRYISLNIGMNFCKGDFITTHDADDISLYDRYEKLVNIFSNNPNVYMVSNLMLRTFSTKFNTNNNVDVIKTVIKEDVSKENKENIYNAMPGFGMLMFKKNIFKSLGNYECIRKGADMIMFEKFMYRYENIKFRENECSHRYLYNNPVGKHYIINEEILYVSFKMNNNNITNQRIHFNINDWRKIISE